MATIAQTPSLKTKVVKYITSFELLPGQIVVLAAAGLIIIGAGFLLLPFSTPPNVELSILGLFNVNYVSLLVYPP